jgi:hypothetical protein
MPIWPRTLRAPSFSRSVRNGRETSVLLARKRRLPHRRWPCPVLFAFCAKWAGNLSPPGAQAPSAPPQVAGSRPFRVLCETGGKSQPSWRASAVCPNAGGRAPSFSRSVRNGRETSALLARKRRLPHRRWPCPVLFAFCAKRAGNLSPHGAQAPSAPPQVVCLTAGGLPHRRWPCLNLIAA